jgi:hypothetical protein
MFIFLWIRLTAVQWLHWRVWTSSRFLRGFSFELIDFLVFLLAFFLKLSNLVLQFLDSNFLIKAVLRWLSLLRLWFLLHWLLFSREILLTLRLLSGSYFWFLGLLRRSGTFKCCVVIIKHVSNIIRDILGHSLFLLSWLSDILLICLRFGILLATHQI